LAVGEAVSISAAKRIGSSRSEEEKQKQKQIDYRKCSADLESTLSSLSETEIVRRLNDGDIVMAQALTLPGTATLTVPKQLELNCYNTVPLMRVCDSSNIPYRLTRTAILSNQ
jgi:hypothetical protein